MKKKCKRCGELREVEYEFVNKKDKQCVFCNDKYGVIKDD